MAAEEPGAGLPAVPLEVTARWIAAVEQSNNPVLSEFAGRLAQLMSGPPRFRNLDVRSVLTNTRATT